LLSPTHCHFVAFDSNRALLRFRQGGFRVGLFFTMRGNLMNVRRNSGKLHPGVIFYLLFILAFSIPADAANITGISGTWATKVNSSYKIGEYNTYTDNSSGTCTFTVQNSLYASMACKGLDGAPSHDYSGGVSVVIRASKLGWSLDSSGINQLTQNMTNRLVRKYRRQGKVLDPSNVSFSIESQIYKPIRLSTDLGAPKLAQGTIKGTVIYRVNNKWITKPFTYKLKINFLYRAP
jgi:hypothetical protein